MKITRGQRRQSQALFGGAQWQHKRQWAHTKTHVFPSEYQETLFHCEGDQVLVAWRGGGISICRDTQNLTGYSPGQPSLADPA